MSTSQMQKRWDSAFMATYGTPPLALDHGRGARVWDVDGKEYVDLYAGIAVSALGHAHPAIVDAVSAQVARLAHTSNFAITEPAVRLGERLSALVDGGARVFLANSGTEANEAAIKLARRHHPQRRQLVAAERGFHGRTMGALSITGNPAKRDPFAPLLPDVAFVPYGDVEALTAAVTDETAAVFLEPVLGESGVIPAPIGYLEAAREACDATGALLVLDEVQGGVGRAGAWFSHQVIAPGVAPDVITMAKGLGGGLPIGACLARGAAADALQPGEHGSTFGGNPVAAAAANAVLDVIESDDLLAEAAKRGEQLSTELSHLPVAQVRGVGLWLAAVLERPVAKDVEAAARAHGVLVNAVAADAIRFAPALTIASDDVEAGVAAFRAALRDVLGES